MYRSISAKLNQWNKAEGRKPLLLQGARQVGKTWALKEFGETSFDALAYVNFMEDRTLGAVFEGDLNPERILRAISLQTGIQVEDQMHPCRF